MTRFTVLVAVVLLLAARPATAGPPFVTDDPVPTDYRNWEIYAGLQYENLGSGAVTATPPFAEFNYGAMPNVQVSASFPVAFDTARSILDYRSGVGEFGIKTRFVQETSGSPQIAFYPSIEIPSTMGMHVVPFLPIWMQKSAGPWTAFGGGGIYLNRGPSQRDYTLFGGALERALSSGTTVGVELYRQGADTTSDRATAAANLGLVMQVGAHHAVLFSCGRGFGRNDTFAGYGSYEFALGPPTSK